MLSHLRHRLWLINYYSADRPVSGLTKARDIALVVSLVVAIAATWTADQLIVRQTVNAMQSGGLVEREDNIVDAVLVSEVGERVPWTRGRPVAEFELKADEESFGWPLRSTHTESRLRIDLNRFDSPDTTIDVALAADDPSLLAIHEAIDLAGLPMIREAARRDHPRSSTHIAGWVFNIAIWWVGLYVIAVIGIHAAHALWCAGKRTVHQRRATLAAEGCCVNCGYDMRGLEFNDRCPECGSLVY